jgi:hypothetical protein
MELIGGKMKSMLKSFTPFAIAANSTFLSVAWSLIALVSSSAIGSQYLRVDVIWTKKTRINRYGIVPLPISASINVCFLDPNRFDSAGC